MAVINLKDMLSPEEKARVERRYAERTNRSKGDNTKIAPEVWIIAKLGVYFGWDAIVSVKRGFIESYTESSDQEMERVLIPFTLEEALMLIDAADTVQNQITARQQSAQYYATSAAMSSSAFDAFQKDNLQRQDANLED